MNPLKKLKSKCLCACTSDEALPGIEDYRAKIKRNGAMRYQFPTVISSYCKLNVRQFPLDSQVCEFVFSSWIYNGFEIDLTPFGRDGSADMDNYQENAAWQVTSFVSKKTLTYYDCCKEPSSEVRYFLHITRRHVNYIVTLVFPCLLISFLPLLGFLLPVSYGEKVSLQITMMLSLAVFLKVITENLPPSSDAMPLLGIYFVCSLSLVGMSSIMTVFVINIHFKSKTFVHPWLKRNIIGRLSWFLLVETSGHHQAESLNGPLLVLEKDAIDIHRELQGNERNRTRQETGERIVVITTYIRTVIKQLRGIERRFEENDSEAARCQDWHVLATIVDRLLFIFFFLFMLVSLLVVFPHPHN